MLVFFAFLWYNISMCCSYSSHDLYNQNRSYILYLLTPDTKERFIMMYDNTIFDNDNDGLQDFKGIRAIVEHERFLQMVKEAEANRKAEQESK